MRSAARTEGIVPNSKARPRPGPSRGEGRLRIRTTQPRRIKSPVPCSRSGHCRCLDQGNDQYRPDAIGRLDPRHRCRVRRTEFPLRRSRRVAQRDPRQAQANVHWRVTWSDRDVLRRLGRLRIALVAHDSTRHDLFERAAFASNDHCGRKTIDVILDCSPASACSTLARCCWHPPSAPDHAIATAVRQRIAARPTLDPPPCLTTARIQRTKKRPLEGGASLGDHATPRGRPWSTQLAGPGGGPGSVCTTP